jgi:macrocin-O-methyltransferase TylF-like protien
MRALRGKVHESVRRSNSPLIGTNHAAPGANATDWRSQPTGEDPAAIAGRREKGRMPDSYRQTTMEVPERQAECRDLYLSLLKRSLTGLLYEDASDQYPTALGEAPRRVGHDRDARVQGTDWPVIAPTMIGLTRLDNIQQCIEQVLEDNVPGDLIETGVWRGGAVIFMRGVLKAHGVTHRTVWAADSFDGLPTPNAAKYPQDAGLHLAQYRQLAIPIEEVRRNFERYGLLDDQVRFLKGWFSDTLPQAPIGKLALLRLDGDLYESTMDALKNLYARVSAGGYVIVDDYSVIPACKRAVHDFRDAHSIRDAIVPIDSQGVFWRKS